MAARRWELDRERRAHLASIDPVQFSRAIVRHIVVIDHETTVREAFIYAFDSRRSATAKLRRVLSQA